MDAKAWMRRAASRAACTAGKSKAIKTLMIAITTKSSINVNPAGLATLNLSLSFRMRTPRCVWRVKTSFFCTDSTSSTSEVYHNMVGRTILLQPLCPTMA
jgi:hypothetical protein